MPGGEDTIYIVYLMQCVYSLTPSGLLADADDQESFDLGLPFFELITFNISTAVYTIDSCSTNLSLLRSKIWCSI